MQEASPCADSRLLENANAIGDRQGTVLREARVNMGYSLNDLAETTGLTVIEIENVESNIDERPEIVKRLVTVLGVTANKL